MKSIKYSPLLASLMIVACGGHSSHEQAGTHTHKDADKHITGKPSAPISMDYTISPSENINVGDTVEINVKLSSASNEKEAVKAKVGYAKSLTPVTEQHKLSFKPGNNNVTPHQAIVVTPQSEGLHYISINASTEVDGKAMAKNFVIPVKVGQVNWKKELQPQGQIVDEGNGAKIIELPASE